jgi:hypothetical protein
MNLSPEDCSKWRKNKLVNPLTGRKIQEGKGVYKDLEKACKDKSSPLQRKERSSDKKASPSPKNKKTHSPRKVGKKNSLRKAPCQEQPGKYEWIVGKGCHEIVKRSPKKASSPLGKAKDKKQSPLQKKQFSLDKKKNSYYNNVIDNLSNKNPIDIETLMQKMNIHSSKLTYIIDAIKKGINENTILKISNPTEKRLYLGHSYILKSQSPPLDEAKDNKNKKDELLKTYITKDYVQLLINKYNRNPKPISESGYKFILDKFEPLWKMMKSNPTDDHYNQFLEQLKQTGITYLFEHIERNAELGKNYTVQLEYPSFSEKTKNRYSNIIEYLLVEIADLTDTKGNTVSKKEINDAFIHDTELELLFNESRDSSLPRKDVSFYFNQIMDRWGIKGNPRTWWIPGYLKKDFIDDVMNTGQKYNIEYELQELMEEQGPVLAIAYNVNKVPSNLKEVKMK